MGKNRKELHLHEMMQEINDFLFHSLGEWKKYVLPAVVAFAVICFWVFGGDSTARESGTILVENELDTDMEDTVSYDGIIYVDIGGAVVSPGVYQIPEGTRLFQVIEMAGGLMESAAVDSINQAEPVTDGQKILIGSLDESSPYYIGLADHVYGMNSETAQNSLSGGAVRMTPDGVIVNINQATLSELQAIPGVGPSTAEKIISYRETNGSFQKPEDLKKISGIGEKTYENLKDYIET